MLDRAHLLIVEAQIHVSDDVILLLLYQHGVWSCGRVDAVSQGVVWCYCAGSYDRPACCATVRHLWHGSHLVGGPAWLVPLCVYVVDDGTNSIWFVGVGQSWVTASVGICVPPNVVTCRVFTAS